MIRSRVIALGALGTSTDKSASIGSFDYSIVSVRVQIYLSIDRIHSRPMLMLLTHDSGHL